MPYPDGERAGQALTVDFVLNGSKFVALNGRPDFTFNESISFMVPCEDQAEVDRYWIALTEDGGRGIHVRLVEGQVRRLVADCACAA
jgi:predicted 3-demethylubiquinone-9 3-methyltransferase (glyoxalase superfamily)